jgi:hypothetical protein
MMFLAGSIEMGVAEDWQSRVATAFADRDELVLLNPRRDAWDASWEQSIDNPVFREQVEWELEGLARADVIALCLVPGTKSPISLLELGLHAASGKVVVHCPAGFWRKGNVDVVCAKYGLEQHDAWDAWVAALRQRS